MSQSENLFDTAISQADDAILRVMGTVATITSGVLAGGRRRRITGAGREECLTAPRPKGRGFPEAF